jgi:hypothetical protein
VPKQTRQQHFNQREAVREWVWQEWQAQQRQAPPRPAPRSRAYAPAAAPQQPQANQPQQQQPQQQQQQQQQPRNSHRFTPLAKNRVSPDAHEQPAAAALEPAPTAAAAGRRTLAWLALWTARLGTPDQGLLKTTKLKTLNMASEALHANINPLFNAQMRSRPFSRSQPCASRPLEITHVDVLQVSQRDPPSHVHGNKIGYKYGAIFIDDYSKHSRVYFARSKAEIPRLIRCYYNDMGTSALFGTDLILGGLRPELHPY